MNESVCGSYQGHQFLFILQRVIEVSKQFLPTLSSGYSSPKLTIHIEDANKYMERHAGEFDVIITDSCDPIGEW